MSPVRITGITFIALAGMATLWLALSGEWSALAPSGPSPKPALKEGDLDARGRLVFLTAPGGVCKSLDYDYAMRVFRDDPNDESSAFTIELYSQPAQRIWRARSVAQFTEHLNEVPPGETLYSYHGTCGESPFFDETVDSRITAACRRRNLILKDSEYNICTCPNRG